MATNEPERNALGESYDIATKVERDLDPTDHSFMADGIRFMRSLLDTWSRRHPLSSIPIDVDEAHNFFDDAGPLLREARQAFDAVMIVKKEPEPEKQPA